MAGQGIHCGVDAMKPGSRGNYRILYRDLEPNQVYSHFTILESNALLLEQEGLDPKKALKAVREMARTHFATVPADGLVDGKKGWYGHRWQVLYLQWGDYLCERDFSIEPGAPAGAAVPSASPSKPEALVPQSSAVAAPAPAARRSFWSARSAQLTARAAIVLLVFTAGYFAQSLMTPTTAVGALFGDATTFKRQRALSEHQGTEPMIFPNLDQTQAVFADGQQRFVLVADRELTIGTAIVLEDASGVVSEIHPGRLVLDTDKGSTQFPFPALYTMGQETLGEGKIAIYPERNNLDKLLDAYCRVHGLKKVGRRSFDSISGRFASEQAFKNACRALGSEIFADRVVSHGSGLPRVFISFDGLWHQPYGTLTDLVGFYAQHLSLEVKQVDVPADQRWVLNYGLQFEEFCAFFDLKTEIRGPYLIVKGDSHESEKIGQNRTDRNRL